MKIDFLMLSFKILIHFILLFILCLTNKCFAQTEFIKIGFPFYLSQDTVKARHIVSMKIKVYNDLDSLDKIREYFFDDFGKFKFIVYGPKDTSRFSGFENACDIDKAERISEGITKVRCNEKGQLLSSKDNSHNTYNKYDKRYNLIESIITWGGPSLPRVGKHTWSFDSLNNPLEDVEGILGEIVEGKDKGGNDTIYDDIFINQYNYVDGILQSVESYVKTDTLKEKFETFRYFYDNGYVVKIVCHQDIIYSTYDKMFMVDLPISLITFEYVKKED
ncbi:MAG: hypothetical protein ABI723_10445 [Bacteroidia bacterium]